MIILSLHGDWPQLKLGSWSTLTCWRVADNGLLTFIQETVKIILAIKFSKENLEKTL